MHKTLAYGLIFLNLIVFISAAIGDAFDETVAEIQDLETILEDTRTSIDQELVELRENHPLNAPKDTFESDADYQNRLSELDAIVAEHRAASLSQITDIQSEISLLYRRVFLTDDVIGTLGTYDANNEFFPITFETADQRIETTLRIGGADAKVLHDNWDKVHVTGWILIDPGYHRGLAQVKIVYPSLWEAGVTWELDEVSYLGNNDSVDWSPDGKYIATGNRKETGVSLWRPSTDKVIKIIIEPGQNRGRGVTALAFSLDSQYIATGSVYAARGYSSWSKTVVWDMRSGQSRTVIEHGTSATVKAITFSPNNAYLATLNLTPGYSTGNVVRIWDLNGGQRGALKHGGAVFAIAFSPEGKYLATGGKNRSGYTGGVVTLWNMNSYKIAWKAEQSDDIRTVDFSPNGKYLAIGGDDGKVTIWDMSTTQSIRQIKERDANYAIAYSPDGKYLAVGGADQAITLYRIGTEEITLETEITKEKSIHTGREVRDLAWSPYGNLISDGNTVYRTLLNPEVHKLESETVAAPLQTPVPVTFTVPSTIRVGERFAVSVNIENVIDLFGGQFDLLFNADVLEVKDINEGDFLSTGGARTYIQVDNIDNASGEVPAINLARLEKKEGVDGTGTLLKVVFRAKATGESLLTLSNLRLGNSSGHAIPSVVTHIKVQVELSPDVDGNGKVDILDLVYVSKHLGTSVKDAPGLDVNEDGKIDILDLIIVSQHLQ